MDGVGKAHTHILRINMTNGIVKRKTLPTRIFSRKYGMPVKRDPKIALPTQIRLPDGRVIQVADIMIRPTNRRSYNLRTKTEYKPRIKPPQDRQTD